MDLFLHYLSMMGPNITTLEHPSCAQRKFAYPVVYSGNLLAGPQS